MLYKKFHRQYLRMWRIGREFKFEGEVYEVARGPYIEGFYIWADGWRLISLISGNIWHTNDMIWLED